VDEAFLDLSDLPQPGEELAKAIQSKINSELHLPCSLGVASNKLVAKIATDEGKKRSQTGSYPNAILVVLPGEEAAFLARMPVLALWGVGPKTATRLDDMGIHTIGDLAETSEATLTRLFGVMGREMGLRARGIDDSPVVNEHEVKSISQEITFDRDVSNGERLRQTLRSMSERVAYRLRSDGLTAGTVRLKIRWSDFSTHTRQESLEHPTDVDGIIYAAVLALFEGIWEAGRPVRLIGVGASKLTERVQQLSLWDTPGQKERRLLEALDALRKRYGEGVVSSGRTIKRKKG
jgi:DNA polymerase-4